MAKIAHSIVKSINSEFLILTPAASGSPVEFLTAYFDPANDVDGKRGAANYVDAIADHPYGGGDPANGVKPNPEDSAKRLNSIRAAMRERGGDLDLYMTGV